MFDQILDRIKTNEDKEKLLEEVDLLLEGLYQEKGFGFESLLKNKIRYWVSLSLSEEFIKEGVDRKTYLLGLKKELNVLKEVSLIIAYEPSEEALDRFYMFLKQALGGKVIINLLYNPHLIGGVQIVYGGQFRDFSFKRTFEKVFEDSRSEIMKILEARTNDSGKTQNTSNNI